MHATTEAGEECVEPISNEGIEPPLWSRAAADEAAFAEEQQILGATWTFVGFLGDLPKDGDWVRARLGGRSIFVQRFGEQIRGFENRCAHRFFPLRTEERGNGPIVCGFHHWRYDKDGLALGIPMCQDVFEKTPREINARLRPVEIGLCGSLIFGRFTLPEGGPTIEEFLGDTYVVLKTICPANVDALRCQREMAANWKFSHHISLDDYHIVAIHPKTFGKNGYLKNEIVKYSRVGPHSVFLASTDADPLGDTVRACRDGTYRPQGYTIINLFPNLVISQAHVRTLRGEQYWYSSVQRFVPISAGTSMVQVWLYRSPFKGGQALRYQKLHRLVERVLSRMVRKKFMEILEEDSVACEKLQSIAGQMTEDQIISAHEKRIAWFEEGYARAMVAGRRRKASPLAS